MPAPCWSATLSHCTLYRAPCGGRVCATTAVARVQGAERRGVAALQALRPHSVRVFLHVMVQSQPRPPHSMCRGCAHTTRAPRAHACTSYAACCCSFDRPTWTVLLLLHHAVRFAGRHTRAYRRTRSAPGFCCVTTHSCVQQRHGCLPRVAVGGKGTLWWIAAAAPSPAVAWGAHTHPLHHHAPRGWGCPLATTYLRVSRCARF